VTSTDAKYQDGEYWGKDNIVELNSVFTNLIDHSRHVGFAYDIFGELLKLHQSQIFIRPPGDNNYNIWHPDGARALPYGVFSSHLPLQIKIQYFLTDLEEADSGNFTIVPGSHNRPFPEGGFKDGPYIPEAIQLCVRAGDAVVFPHALWHGFVANRSRNSRKTLVYCYVHQCLRAFDYYDVSDELMERCTPRQRRLIGDIGEWQPGSYFYSPPDQVQMIEGIMDG